MPTESHPLLPMPNEDDIGRDIETGQQSARKTQCRDWRGPGFLMLLFTALMLYAVLDAGTRVSHAQHDAVVAPTSDRTRIAAWAAELSQTNASTLPAPAVPMAGDMPPSMLKRMGVVDINSVNFTVVQCAPEGRQPYARFELPENFFLLNPDDHVHALNVDNDRCLLDHGRRLTSQENADNCQVMACGSSSGAAGSSASGGSTPYEVHPCLAAGQRDTLTARKGHLGPNKPKWPPPTATGQYYTPRFETCSTPKQGDCCWKAIKGYGDKAQRYECDSRDKTKVNHKALDAAGTTATAERHKQIIAKGGTTATAERNRQRHARGENTRQERERRAKEKGITVAQLRHQEEVTWRNRHGLGHRPSRVGWGNLANVHELMKEEPIASTMWDGDYTGAAGHVDEADSTIRDEIMADFFGWFRPTLATGGIKHLVEHQAKCGNYIVGDTEFGRITKGDLDLDDSDDVPARDAWSRTYDLSLILVDCRGNVKYTLFHERNNDVKTPLDAATKQRAVDVLKGRSTDALPAELRTEAATILPMIRAAMFIFWGNPEIVLAQLADRRPADRSDGVDVRQELLRIIPGCRPTGSPAFSLSQNLLVPFLGIRLGPFHKALQDTKDEAVTITTILRGLINFYMNPPPAPTTPSCTTTDLNLKARVTSSGNRKRSMTIREAIIDEQDGGSFLADMTDIEFAKYQQLIWQAETPQPKKPKQAKLGGGSS